jgi:hypothetical protein
MDFVEGVRDPLQAAIGYLQLGMWQEAADEIESLPPERRVATEVLMVRLKIYEVVGAGELEGAIRRELARRGVGEPGR